MALERLRHWYRASVQQPDRSIFRSRIRAFVSESEDYIPYPDRTVFNRSPPPPPPSPPYVYDPEDSEEQLPSRVSSIASTRPPFVDGSSSWSPFPDVNRRTSRRRYFPSRPIPNPYVNSLDPEDSEEQSSTDIESIESSSAGEEPGPGLDECDDPQWSHIDSGAKKDWDYQKNSWHMSNAALDSLMGMIGLEVVKAKFVEINNLIATAKRQKAKVSKEKFGIVFIGNPGTGKTTVAKLYANFLHTVGVIPCNKLEITTGTRLASDGVRGCQLLLENLKKGGVLLVDEAHQMISTGTPGGSAVLDLLLSEVEKLTGKVVFIFAGYGKQMETFTGHNPSFPTLIPTTIQFLDYNDVELHLILIREMKLKFGKRLMVEGGKYGRLMRIVIKRIGRGRGKYGFGNAREVQKVLLRIRSRQANRLFQSMKAEQLPNDMLLTQEDLIGPAPSMALLTSTAWKKLQEMIGLKEVKKTVEILLHILQINYERELAEKPLVECSLNKLFLGNPGTGKTTVAKLYGNILADIGMLSNGDVVIKNSTDFIGEALGQSERNTRAILDSTLGKVLIIDEAYMLGGGVDRLIQPSDPFRTAIVDTIVGEVQSTAAEDRCVLLLGYQDRMEAMLNDVNPALSRRFPLASAFIFKDYTMDELREILNLKLHQQGFRATEDAVSVALEVLGRAQHRPGFGNAGEIDILLDRAKLRQYDRLYNCHGEGATDLFLPVDIDEDFERSSRALGNIKELFSDFFGCEPLIQKLEGYQLAVRKMRTVIQDPSEVIPFNFLFRGPPGTGKTTTAKKMGAVFYEMGFLATKDVVECSATDLIGEFVGHTGPKTKKLMESALGRVLFIDEAYKLGEGQFGKEAMIEMVNNLTRDRYRNKLVTILAGYEHEINTLMSINPGLTSRFPEVVDFNNLSIDHCIALLIKCLKSKKLDTSILESSPYLRKSLTVHFKKLSILPSWGNSRDIQTLAKTIVLKVMATADPQLSLTVPEEMVVDETMKMTKERQNRAAAAAATTAAGDSRDAPLPCVPDLQAPPSSRVHIPAIEVAQEDEDASEKYKSGLAKQRATTKVARRDPGVSDEIWDQLQLGKQATMQLEANLKNSRKMLAHWTEEVTKSKTNISENSVDPERWRLRLDRVQQMREGKRKNLEKEEREARKEKETQDYLDMMGRCPQNYEWIKQPDGYRCAGGTHAVSWDELKKGGGLGLKNY
ncbi:P-loop containing nucleoside triphosphate hydrolase protein [Leptodontidium sp. 2 PMI_412]|nr:P-loop containing nucleoside triphosphate hydrolase protein [Leptodontidium sp. 2 PMI_412]